MKMENNENENIPEEQFAPEPQASSQTESAVQPAPAKAEKPQLSRFRRFWRTSLVWLAVVAITFTAGVLTFNFLRYQPQVKELAQAYVTTTDLQNQVNSLTTCLLYTSDAAD